MHHGNVVVKRMLKPSIVEVQPKVLVNMVIRYIYIDKGWRLKYLFVFIYISAANWLQNTVRNIYEYLYIYRTETVRKSFKRESIVFDQVNISFQVRLLAAAPVSPNYMKKKNSLKDWTVPSAFSQYSWHQQNSISFQIMIVI